VQEEILYQYVMGLRERSDRLSFNEGIFIHRVFERLFREYPQFREHQGYGQMPSI